MRKEIPEILLTLLKKIDKKSGNPVLDNVILDKPPAGRYSSRPLSKLFTVLLARLIERVSHSEWAKQVAASIVLEGQSLPVPSVWRKGQTFSLSSLISGQLIGKAKLCKIFHLGAFRSAWNGPYTFSHSWPNS